MTETIFFPIFSADEDSPEKPDGEKRSSKKKIHDNVSIEDALKALTMTPEGACNVLKTPVSVLQEILSRHGLTPTYDLVQIEGGLLLFHRMLPFCMY